MKKALVLIEPLTTLLVGSVFGLIITGVVLATTSANDMVLWTPGIDAAANWIRREVETV